MGDPIMIRRTLLTRALGGALAGALVCALACVTTLADPFTTAFGDIDSALTDLQADTTALSGSQKKLVKKSLKALGKDSTSVKTDVVIAAKLIKLEKRFSEDATVVAGLDSMVTGVSGAVQARFDEVSDAVDALVTAKPADKAAKLRDQASAFLDRAAAAETRKDVIKSLKKAIAKTEGAQKQVDKANTSGGGGGGGGGGDDQPCEFRSPGAGESGSVTFEGVQLEANQLEVFLQRDAGAITNFTVAVGRCTKKPDVYRIMELTVPGPPDVGVYSVNLMNGAFALERTSKFGGFSTFGTITIEKRENGKIEGSFVTRQDIDPPILVSFVVDDVVDQQ
jgi:hypothetical protein